MKKLLLLFTLALLFVGRAAADEGMWLLPYIQKLNFAQMKQLGLKLSAEDIYSINKSSLKDAIVIFGGGCTGEVISSQGLVLTNHHCGFGSIQKLSSVEHDYLQDGFWAQTLAEELPSQGLAVTFVKQIIDVTDQIIPQLSDTMSRDTRSAKVREIVATITPQYEDKTNGISADVEVFFGGNQYILYTYQVFRDVRLVGTPPSSIGKFGGDTDNWMWPRHTGDFSMFRIYADKNGNPAEYSADNVPYVPVKHLNISLKGYKEGDFAMIMGFPGSTDRYMTSFEIDETLEQDNPNRILVRGIRQEILKKDMAADQKIRIQYASKYAGSSNYWKNSIGMNRGLKRLKVKNKKLATEAAFTAWVAADPARTAKYGEALDLIKEGVEGRRPYTNIRQFMAEAMFSGTELVSIASMGGEGSRAMYFKDGVFDSTMTPRLQRALDKFYKDYSPSTDRKVAKAMFKLFIDNIPEGERPAIFAEITPDVDKYVDNIFDNSIFASQDKVMAYFANPSEEVLVNDPAVKLYESIYAKYVEMSEAADQFNVKFSKGHRLFVAGILEMEPDKAHYPDANFTIRLTYGSVMAYSAADAVYYKHYTTLKGVIEKEDPTNDEFVVPTKLVELYETRDFGRYGVNGELPVAFLTTNDITGGNSGSPVMNDRGELIGTAFDGNWEAMSGDIAFEPELQRCINVDIRYVLFIVDKFAGCTRLTDEMTIITK